MENFIVSARKYRPQTFDTVVGQQAITSTLKNAIKSKHLAQAFLFCGPRGVGKTTCARILAKTINCMDLQATTEACDQCVSCVSFNEGRSLNIYELDAASNNSVDDIRALIEQVNYAPQIGQFKVYIIDEVHMLSTNAFNAFLKTLEEPPKHAIFILATTEKHKIIPTILSRCQIFDFNRIQLNDIALHLKSIAEKENIQADPEALHIIAQKADGGLRDALSIFDQIVSFAGNEITYKSVIENLNILDYDYYFKITDAIIAADIKSVLLLFDEILSNGFDGHIFNNGLASHFRDLLVCKDEQTLILLEASENIKEKYKVQAQNIPVTKLIDGLEILSKSDVNYKASKSQRLLIELTLMQLCSLDEKGEKKKSELVPIIAPIGSDNPNYLQQQKALQLKSNKNKVVLIKKPVIENEIIEKDGHRIPVTRDLTKLKTISISQSLRPDKKTEDQGENNSSNLNQVQEEFTNEQFLACWNDYAIQLKILGKSTLHIALTKRIPEINSNFEITLTIDNKSQEQSLEREKQDLLEHLRTRLKNYNIQLKTVIAQGDDSAFLYTSKEKFKKMAEKNPNLLLLQKRLNLDIEF